MSHLIDDLLDLSRITRGKILLRKEHLDLAALLRTTIEDHRPTLEVTGLTLEIKLPQQPVWTTGDPTRLSQAVGNLLHNAGKFTDPGGRVLVELQTASQGDTALITVRDTGIGMEPEMLARAFESFSQADRSLSRSRGGLGLGLALVKGLAELHGGTVKAASPGLGRGSEFTICLPLHRPVITPAPTPAAAVSNVRARRILVIEDNLDAAESLRLLLELTGHQVALAFDGTSGVEKARQFQPEVVLCDIGLPGERDGYAVARTVRSDPALSSIYLIAMTGYGQAEDQRRAREAGFDLHLTKPADPLVLDRLLANAPVRA